MLNKKVFTCCAYSTGLQLKLCSVNAVDGFQSERTNGSIENEDPENEDRRPRKRRPLRKRRPHTKTKTPYENEDPLRKRRPPTKTAVKRTD